MARKKATDMIDDAVQEITKVKNTVRANQIVFAVTGKPIAFDANGIAEPDKEDLDYLLTIPGYTGYKGI